MSAQSGDAVPTRGRGGSWTPSARLHAAGQLRSRLMVQRTPSEIARVGAAYFHELFTARTVTVSTLDSGQYHDLVSIGYLPPREQFYPPDSTYAASLFPLAVKELNEHQGYFTADLNDPKYAEFVGSRHDSDVASIMGVAMMTAGTLRGEVFCTRSHEQEAFDREDLDLARDLSTSFASVLMAAMGADATS